MTQTLDCGCVMNDRYVSRCPRHEREAEEIDAGAATRRAAVRAFDGMTLTDSAREALDWRSSVQWAAILDTGAALDGVVSPALAFAGLAYHAAFVFLDARLIADFPDDDVGNDDRRAQLDATTVEASLWYVRLLSTLRDSAGHPLAPELRKAGRQYAYEIDAARERAGLDPARLERLERGQA